MKKLAIEVSSASSDTSKHSPRCPHWQGNRRNPVATRPQLTDTPRKPFDKLGPFLPSLGRSYRLTRETCTSSQDECFPVPDMKATMVWSTLEKELFPRHGHPTIVVTDCGAEFVNQVFREGCDRLSTEELRHTPRRTALSNGFNGRWKKVSGRW